MYVTLFHYRPKPDICRLKPVTCRPAQEHSRHEPVTDCRPEPPCVVTDIPKRGSGFWVRFSYDSHLKAKFFSTSRLACLAR